MACDDVEIMFSAVRSITNSTTGIDCVKLEHQAEQLRHSLMQSGNQSEPGVLNHSAAFNAAFCFLLEPSDAVEFLKYIGEKTVNDWSTLVNTEPLKLVEQLEQRPSEERAAIIVIFLYNSLRVSVMLEEAISSAKTARTAGRPSVSVNQEGLNNALMSCVHFCKLMRHEGQQQQQQQQQQQVHVVVQQLQLLLAAFTVVAQALLNHGQYELLKKMMNLSEAVFALAEDIQHCVVDLCRDVTAQFLPKLVAELIAEDGTTEYCVPYRMIWLYQYTLVEREISKGLQWQIYQPLSNAVHYCADTASIMDDGRFSLNSWQLYGLCLFDCGLYATAKEILKMEHMKELDISMSASKCAARCLRECEEKQTENDTSVSPLLYFGNTNGDRKSETNVWSSIYDDPPVRQYECRSIPDYKRLCITLTASDLSDNVLYSCILSSLEPLIDLAYRSAKPMMEDRSDSIRNVYAGSVNEKLDLQSHVDRAHTEEEDIEVPDIDMMMAVTPDQIGIPDCFLDTSQTKPGYAYLVNRQNEQRMPSFELLHDSLPIAYRQVANFVSDTEFPCKYTVRSITIHGPAISSKIQREDEPIRCYDHTPAFWIKTWPSIADEWRNRKRQFGWPPAAVLEEVVSEGVLIVATCHPTSEDPTNEWRISFSMAERTLVDTLSSTQRLAYLYAKLVWTAFLKRSSFIVSYHLKNALLWLCEGQPAEFWRYDNLLECVAEIFRWLRRELAAGHLHNYMIPGNNLILASAGDNTDDVVHLLDDILHNVFQHIVEADRQLGHIALLDGLRIGELLETVNDRCHVSADVPLVNMLRQHVSSLPDELLKNRQDLLRALGAAAEVRSEQLEMAQNTPSD